MAAWADLARGLVSEDEVRIMEAHLDSGCADCKNIARFLTKMATFSGRMAGGSAPDAAVRLAKAIFPGRPGEPNRIRRIAAELIFDSRSAVAVAGMRSIRHVGWQRVYRAGDCILDVRIEPESHTSRAAVIGQISSQNAPTGRLSALIVRLQVGRSVVAETLSNQFGEFQFEYEQQSRLQLCVFLEGGSRCIQVPLRKIAPDQPTCTDHRGFGATAGKKRLGAGSSS